MSNIKFEITKTEIVTTSSNYGIVANWVREIAELAKQHEGQTLAIYLEDEKHKWAGKEITVVPAVVATMFKPRGNRRTMEGFKYMFRNLKSSCPMFYITYNKPFEYDR